jgi:predicted O-methyltransferase YrrM
MLITRLLRELFTPKTGSQNMPAQTEDSKRAIPADEYSFTSDWFSGHVPVWSAFIDELAPVGKILEIGSYEGRSTAWLIENAFKASGKGEIFCIDTWAGGVEHRDMDMQEVEQRFIHNTGLARTKTAADVAIQRCKGASFEQLVALNQSGHGATFDLIYVDGGHQCADVLGDLVLAFALCKVGGLIICDDYLWLYGKNEKQNLLNQPKLAIDSFVNCYAQKLRVRGAPLYQLFIQKTAE